MAIKLISMDSLALVDRAGGDVFAYVFGDTGPGKFPPNKVEGLIAAEMASRRIVVI